MGPLRSNAPAAEERRLPAPGIWTRVSPQRGFVQKPKQAMKDAKERHVAVTEVKELRQNYLVLELFAGCARLTMTAVNRDRWEIMAPVDIIYGQDLHDPHPDLVTMSPRCGPWSQFQRINPNIDRVMEERQQDIPLWRFCRAIWDEQTHGRLAFTDNASQSAALMMGPFMMACPNLHRAKVPQCAFGPCDVIGGKPNQKYTAFDVNDEDMKEALLVGAVCDHAAEEHQPIEGNVFYEGRWQRRSALAARWPQQLCDHILWAAEQAWEKCDAEAPHKNMIMSSFKGWPGRDLTRFAKPLPTFMWCSDILQPKGWCACFW